MTSSDVPDLSSQNKHRAGNSSTGSHSHLRVCLNATCKISPIKGSSCGLVQMSNKLRTFGDPHFYTDVSDRCTRQKHTGKQRLCWEGCQEPRCICRALEQQLGHLWPRQQGDGENPRAAGWVMMLLFKKTTKKALHPAPAKEAWRQERKGFFL